MVYTTPPQKKMGILLLYQQYTIVPRPSLADQLHHMLWQDFGQELLVAPLEVLMTESWRAEHQNNNMTESLRFSLKPIQ